MLFADILLYLSLAVFTVLLVNCCWLATVALFPDAVSRAQAAYSRPGRLLLLGLLGSSAFLILGVGLVASNNPVGRYLGGAIFAIPCLVGLAGSACLSQRIGAGLPSPVDEAQPWRRVLRGGIVLSIIFLMPFIGWILIFPFTLLSGVGALVHARLEARKRNVAPATFSTPPVAAAATPGA